MKLSLSLAIILASLAQANAATYMLLSQTNAFAAGITNQAKAYTDSVAGGANWTADGTTNSDLAGIAMVHGVVATNSIQAPMLVVSTSGSGAVVRPGGSAVSVTRYDSASTYTLPLNSGLFQVDADGSFGFASANNNFTTVDTRIGRSSAGVASVAGWLVTNRLELLGSLISAAEDIAVADIDVSTGSVFSKSLGADTVFTFSNLADGQWWTVILTNGASWTVTWPTVTWLSGSAPVMDTGAGVINVFSFTRQNGVTIGDVSQQASAILNAIAALANGTGALTNDGAGNFGYYNGYAPLASPALTGDPTVPTATPGDNDTTAASTAFVTAAVAAGGGGITGTVSNNVASSGLLSVDATKTNGIAATFSHVQSALQTSAVGLPTDPGSTLMVKPDGTLTWVNPRNFISIQEDFSGGSDAGSLYAWSTTAVAGNAANVGNIGNIPGAQIGSAWLRTINTSVPGYSAISLLQTSGVGFSVGDGETFNEWRVRVSVVGSDANAITLNIGLQDNRQSTNVTDGVFFRYVHNENEGKWTGCTASGGSVTTNTTWSGALTANVWYRLGIHVNAAGTSATFYVDGTPIATNTANINVTEEVTGLAATQFRHTADTATGRDLSIDYMRYYKWLTSSR